MTWEPSKARWRKMYRGKVYTVSCLALGAPPNKSDSYAAANDWWRRRQAEIDALRPLHPHREVLAGLARRRDWAARHGQHEERRRLDAEIERVTPLSEHEEPGHTDPSIAESIKVAEMFGIVVPTDIDPAAAKHFFGDARVWQDRFRREGVESTPEDRTMGSLAEAYIGLAEARHRSGQLSASEFDLVRRSVRSFRDWMGDRTTADTVTPQTWERWYTHLLTSEASISWKKKQWRHSREFVTHLANLGRLTLPPNVSSRKYRFGDEPRSIETFTVEEFRRLLDSATGRLRLVILLGLNCGFTQKDCADLKQSEVDWKGGRIVRSRSKTRKQTRHSPLVVSYPLWPRTFELLRQYRGDGELAFTTDGGLPWVRRTDRSKSDAVMSSWRHLQQKTGLMKPPKLLRKTGATMLVNSGKYGDLDWLYLGDKPRTIPDRHYSARSGDRFDEAIRWLGSQFGLCEAESSPG